MYDAYYNRETSTRDALVKLSALQASRFICFREAGTKFCPGPYYHDEQSTSESHQFTIAKQKLDFPDDPLYIFQSGTDRLENAHGALRTIEHSSKSDCLQVEERWENATVIESLNEKHPKWRPYLRRLNHSLDHVDEVVEMSPGQNPRKPWVHCAIFIFSTRAFFHKCTIRTNSTI